jgi:hypothetical protein
MPPSQRASPQHLCSKNRGISSLRRPANDAGPPDSHSWHGVCFLFPVRRCDLRRSCLLQPADLPHTTIRKDAPTAWVGTPPSSPRPGHASVSPGGPSLAPPGLPGLRPAGRLPGGRGRAAAAEWWPVMRGLLSRCGPPRARCARLRLAACLQEAARGHAARGCASLRASRWRQRARGARLRLAACLKGVRAGPRREGTRREAAPRCVQGWWRVGPRSPLQRPVAAGLQPAECGLVRRSVCDAVPWPRYDSGFDS